ncbi:MAG: phosphoribosyltransferase family protein [Campylobacterota bacterium]|nr:phosphoribosyltransferase family protein [Campylobacterota bacterium]
MYDYTYNELENDITTLTHKAEIFEADTILAIARGGCIAAQLLTYRLNIRNLQTIQIQSYDQKIQRDTLTLSDTTDLSQCKRVLIVDDIVDSGNTLCALVLYLKEKYPQIEFKTASLFFKPTASIQPDFTCKEATEWINFFWEV